MSWALAKRLCGVGALRPGPEPGRADIRLAGQV